MQWQKEESKTQKKKRLKWIDCEWRWHGQITWGRPVNTEMAQTDKWLDNRGFKKKNHTKKKKMTHSQKQDKLTNVPLSCALHWGKKQILCWNAAYSLVPGRELLWAVEIFHIIKQDETIWNMFYDHQMSELRSGRREEVCHTYATSHTTSINKWSRGAARPSGFHMLPIT